MANYILEALQELNNSKDTCSIKEAYFYVDGENWELLDSFEKVKAFTEKCGGKWVVGKEKRFYDSYVTDGKHFVGNEEKCILALMDEEGNIVNKFDATDSPVKSTINWKEFKMPSEVERWKMATGAKWDVRREFLDDYLKNFNGVSFVGAKVGNKYLLGIKTADGKIVNVRDQDDLPYNK